MLERLTSRFRRRRVSVAGAPLTLAQSWWLFAAAGAALLPLLEHIPAWLSGTAAVVMCWRALLTWRGARLPPRWLLLLLVICGCIFVALQYRSLFGRNPGLALLVIFLALKLMELRSPRDGIMVVLLSCFLLLTGFFFVQTIPAALLSGAALVIIIGALLTLQAPAPPWTTLKRSAMLLTQASPFMLVFFLLFPRVQGPLWGLPIDAYTAASGLTERMSPGSISQIAQSDAIAFRVRFKGALPPPTQQYWRGLTMSDYDGTTWRYRPQPEARELAYVPTGDGVDYEVTLEPHNQRWLFAMERPGMLPPDAVFSADGLLLADQPVRQRLRYEMRSYPVYAPPPQESPRILRAALKLPDSGNPRARAAAEQWRGKPDREILDDAMRFFQGQILAYTLNPPLMQEDAVDDFLFNQKRGFCEHFASSFAFIMRAAGVPARVVGGYQGGEVNPVDGYFTVRQYDAHAWVEVWLDGRGWVRVDPTAESAPRRIADGLANAVSGAEAPLMARVDYAWLRELRYRWDAAQNTWNQTVLGFNPQRQRELMASLGMQEPDWKKMSAWLAGFSGVLLGGLTLLAIGRRQKRDPAGRLWHAFLRRARRAGADAPAWMGPLALAEHLAAQMPGHAAAIRGIAECYAALRYAPASLTPPLRQLQTRIAGFKP